jgi:feruloyl esterase
VPCEALGKLVLPHVAIREAKVVPAVAVTEKSEAVPAHCRVVATSRPTADSEIGIVVAIPEGAAWNGRYEQLGNGGFAGSVYEWAITDSLAHGYATAATDDGHQSGSPEVSWKDASWAPGHPEKLVDFGYRAIKETTDLARALILAHTGGPAKYSYFHGCSEGGREAFVEAQRYPDDFDGIIAGAPALHWDHLFLGIAWNTLVQMQTPRSALPPAKLKAIEAAALEACGDADGVVQDPPSCHFDPASLRCRGAETADCLTAPQLEALRKIYQGARDPRTHEQLEAGFEPGAEAEAGGWDPWIVNKDGPAAAYDQAYAIGFFRDMVFADPKYELRRLDFSRDPAVVDAKVGAILDTNDANLAPFKKSGGKLLQWHGWNDQGIPPRASIEYFDRVQARMGDTADFYRLFMLPGVLHCGGGRGADDAPVRKAITAWVEQGTPPDQMIATKHAGEESTSPVVRRQLLCPYPRRAVGDACAPPHALEGKRSR